MPVCNEPITETQDGLWNGTEHRMKWGMVQLNLNMEHVHACNGSPEQTQGAYIFYRNTLCPNSTPLVNTGDESLELTNRT